MWGSTVCFTAERAARREGDRGGGSGAARGRKAGAQPGVSALAVPPPQPEEGGGGAATAGTKKPKGQGDGPAEGLAAEAGRRSGCKSARRPAVYCDKMDQ